MSIRVKICGITRVEDAKASLDLGADAIGFVFYPKSPRYIEPTKAKDIVSYVSPFITSVGVFVNESLENIISIANTCKLDVIQLHGDEQQDIIDKIPRKIVKAIRIKDETDLQRFNLYSDVDAFLLDTFVENKLGGTGQVFDWKIAEKAKSKGKIILSGGLNPDNIAEAISKVKPYGVDVSSGIELMPGKKDYALARRFLEACGKIG